MKGLKHTTGLELNWVCVGTALFVWGCVGNGLETGPPRVNDGARYLWVSTACADGPLDLAPVGFAEELIVRQNGDLSWLDRTTTVVRDGCTQTALWVLTPGRQVGGPESVSRDEEEDTGVSRGMSYVAASEIALPVGRPCPVSEEKGTPAHLAVDGETAVLEVRRSAYCRGFDAEFTYRRIAPREPAQRDVILRFFAWQNIRNARESAAMFAKTGELIEPFSRTHDGRPMHHVGLESIRAYFERAFSSAQWSAYRVLKLRRQGGNEWVVQWEYMDAELKTPLKGRSLFVVGGRKLFAMQVQALSIPKPR